MNIFSEKISSILEQYADSKIKILCSHYGIDLDEAKRVITDSETKEVITDSEPKKVKKNELLVLYLLLPLLLLQRSKLTTIIG